MCRIDLDPAFGSGVDPSAKDSATWKYQRMRAGFIDNGQLQFLIERCAGNRLPHPSMLHAVATDALIQIMIGVRPAASQSLRKRLICIKACSANRPIVSRNMNRSVS
jgi:hypothetical protein